MHLFHKAVIQLAKMEEYALMEFANAAKCIPETLVKTKVSHSFYLKLISIVQFYS